MDIAQNIQTMQAKLTEVACQTQRCPDDITLLAVSKGQSIANIKCAYLAGIKNFGENYLNEAASKMQALSDLPLTWHFIGKLQSNKAKTVAQLFSWVHSVDRVKTAMLLNEARADTLPPLNICLQINFGEAQKSGVAPDKALDLAAQVAALPRLKLRGLMFIAPLIHDEKQQYLYFARLKELLNLLNSTLTEQLDTLSMGMSGDWPVAVRAGSTMVRIGTALFGNRI